MKIIGVTGQIGCGKSFLCRKFNETYGIPVFYFDIESKKILSSDSNVISVMKELFGEEIYEKSTLSSKLEINSKKLAEIIFKDVKLRQKVEKLIRGPILHKFYNFVYLWENYGDYPFVLAESATMTSTNLYKLMDEIILVDADDTKRMDKLVNERHVDEADAKRRISLQHMINEQICIFQNTKIPFKFFLNDYTEEAMNEFVEEFYNAEMRMKEMEENNG